MTRFQRQQQIEDSITDFCPDPQEMVEIIHALQAHLKRAYEDKSIDVQEALSEACSALDELEKTMSVPCERDAMDIARWRTA